MKAAERRPHKLLLVNERQFGLKPEKSTIDAAIVLRGCKKCIMPKEQSCMCFYKMNYGFDKKTREVLELVTRKKVYKIFTI